MVSKTFVNQTKDIITRIGMKQQVTSITANASMNRLTISPALAVIRDSVSEIPSETEETSPDKNPLSSS